MLLILYFYFRILFAQNHRNLSILLFFLVFTGLAEAVWGLLQLYGFTPSQHGLFKTTGSFFNPGPYAGYLAVVFPLAMWLRLWLRLRSATGTVTETTTGTPVVERSRNESIFGIVTCIAILLVLPATMSRAAWLAAAAGSLVVVMSFFAERFKIFEAFRKFGVKAALISIAVIVLLSVAFAGMYRLKKDSADGRALMWKVALQTAKKHPFGVGLGNFPGAYGDAQAAYFASGQASEAEESVAGSPEYGFNEYLQISIEWGIIPLVLFLCIMMGSLYIAYKRKLWGILASMISLLVFAFFSYPFSVLPFLIVFVFLLAISGTISTQMTQINRMNANEHLKSAAIRLICVICVLITAFCLYNRYPTYNAYKEWHSLRQPYQTKSYDRAKREYEQLYPQLNDQFRFLFEYGHLLSRPGDYEKSNQILQQASRISGDPMIYNIMGKNYQALKEYRQAEACFIKSTQIVPNRLYPFYLLTKLYREMGLQDKVIEMADIVQTKEPKVQSTAVREMKEEAEQLTIDN